MLHYMGKKKALSDGITLRILRWGDYLGLSPWVLSIFTSILIRESQGNLRIGLMLPQPRSIGIIRSKEARKEFSPIASGENMALLTSWLWPNNTGLGLPTSIFIFKSPGWWLICYISPRRLISPHTISLPLISCQRSLQNEAQWMPEHKPKQREDLEDQKDICFKGQGKKS